MRNRAARNEKLAEIRIPTEPGPLNLSSFMGPEPTEPFGLI